AGVVERAMVRAPDPEVARLEALPQRVPVGGVAKRRRADVFGAFEAVAGEVGVAEREVLRARFGVDRAAATVGAAHLLERRRAGDVHYEQRRAGDLGQADRPVRRLGLDELRAGEAVESRRGVAARERL